MQAARQGRGAAVGGSDKVAEVGEVKEVRKKRDSGFGLQASG